jgi:hypothetical protein
MSKRHAVGLLHSIRDGRTIIYRSNVDGMRALIGFLVSECCDGHPELCNLVAAAAAASCGPTPAKTRLAKKAGLAGCATRFAPLSCNRVTMPPILQTGNPISMRKGEVECPSCGAWYRRIEIASMKGEPGEYTCQLCGQPLERFSGETYVAYRLTVQPIGRSSDDPQ